MLAYGLENGLFHAHKAVEEAEWALQRYGDVGIGERMLAQAKEALEYVQQAHSVVNGEDDAGDEVANYHRID